MNEADSPDQPTVPVPIEPAEIPAVTESIASAVPQPAPSEGWQTVDFPGAMSVDAIPHSPKDEGRTVGQSQPETLDEVVPQGVMHYSGAEISPAVIYGASMPAGTADRVMQQLQQENVALRDRLMQAEQALVQQLEGRLAAESGGSSAFEPTQQKLQQLLQELERSHQTAQRQQILVETLTEQLGSSQERIAQLERDCALTQQRHNEQVQQVLQAESNCRDLRLRLHRQQQQTLQFKAALEKSLEMPTPYGNPVMPDIALVSDAATPDVLAALLPKNQPVKPWSVTEKASQDPADQTDRSRSLLKLLNHGSLLQDNAAGSASEGVQALPEAKAAAPFSDRPADNNLLPAEPSALLDPDDPQFVTQLMQLIFPTTADLSSYVVAEVRQSEPLLDIGSVAEAELETERAEATGLPTLDVSSAVTFISPDRPSDRTTLLATAAEKHQPNTVPDSPDTIASPLPAVLSANRSTDPMWDHLATLIDPQQPIEHVNLVTVTADRPQGEGDPVPASIALPDSAHLEQLEDRPLLTTSTTAIPPFFAAAAAPVAVPSPNDAATTAQTAWTWRDRLVKAGKIARSTDMAQTAQSAPLLALSAAGRQPVPEPTSVSNSIEMTPMSVAVMPSPIVYPQRSTKKLASLAAVDLPTFPKR